MRGRARQVVQAGSVGGDVTVGVSWRWLVLVVGACLVAVVVVVWRAGPAITAGHALPAGTVSVAVVADPPQVDHTALLKPNCALQHVEGDARDTDVVGEWAKSETATLAPAGEIELQITVQNPSDSELLLMGIDIVDLTRSRPPTSGFFMPSGFECGSDVPPRLMSVDLGSSPPRVSPYTDGSSPVTSFPYQVRRGDPEVFVLNFGEVQDLVEFAVALDVVVGGARGGVRIDRGGRPFRFTGTGGLPRYGIAAVGSDYTLVPR